MKKTPPKKEITMAKKKEPEQKTVQFDCLAVTTVHVYPFKESPTLGKTKAYATVVLNDQLQLRGLRVIDGDKGLFVGYPNDPYYKGDDYRSIYAPLTRDFREHVENCVLEKYQEVLSA